MMQSQNQSGAGRVLANLRVELDERLAKLERDMQHVPHDRGLIALDTLETFRREIESIRKKL